MKYSCKLCTLFIGVFFLSLHLTNAQSSRTTYPDSLFSNYYHQKVSLFKALPETTGGIIFLGNSITDGGEWKELFPNHVVYNRGISGDHTIGILNRLNEVILRKPEKIFLLIGTNDLAIGLEADSVFQNMMLIAEIIHETLPETGLFIQSIFPVNDNFKFFQSHISKSQEISLINESLKSNSGINYTYIDVYSSLLDKSKKLDQKFTNDGLHLTGEGYLQWKEAILAYLD